MNKKLIIAIVFIGIVVAFAAGRIAKGIIDWRAAIIEKKAVEANWSSVEGTAEVTVPPEYLALANIHRRRKPLNFLFEYKKPPRLISKQELQGINTGEVAYYVSDATYYRTGEVERIDPYFAMVHSDSMFDKIQLFKSPNENWAVIYIEDTEIFWLLDLRKGSAQKLPVEYYDNIIKVKWSPRNDRFVIISYVGPTQSDYSIFTIKNGTANPAKTGIGKGSQGFTRIPDPYRFHFRALDARWLNNNNVLIFTSADGRFDDIKVCSYEVGGWINSESVMKYTYGQGIRMINNRASMNVRELDQEILGYFKKNMSKNRYKTDGEYLYVIGKMTKQDLKKLKKDNKYNDYKALFELIYELSNKAM